MVAKKTVPIIGTVLRIAIKGRYKELLFASPNFA